MKQNMVVTIVTGIFCLVLGLAIGRSLNLGEKIAQKVIDDKNLVVTENVDTTNKWVRCIQTTNSELVTNLTSGCKGKPGCSMADPWTEAWGNKYTKLMMQCNDN